MAASFEFFGAEDLFAGNGDPAAADGGDAFDKALVGVVVEHIIDDFDRGIIGDAEAVDETGLHAEFLEAGADGFAAAVHHDHLHADGFQQHDIAHGFLRELGILHGAAAEFDDCDRILEFLDERKCFVQHIRFVDK